MLKAVVADLNTVDEGHRAFYVEKNGKFLLNVTPADGYELDDVKGLKSALSAERQIVQGLEGKLKPFEGLDAGTARSAIQRLADFGDLDPVKAKEAIETAERLLKIDPTKEAERLASEKVAVEKKQLQDAWGLREKELNQAVEATKTVAESLKSQLKTLMVDNEIKGVLSSLNPIDDARDAIEIMASRFVQTREVNGNYVVEVLDEKGTPRIKDHHGTPFTVADLLTEIKEAKPALFKADDKRGIGMQPSGGSPKGNSGVVNPWSKETRNVTQQMMLTRTQPDLAKRLKAEAGVV